jgi:hypothetical protein
MDESAGEKPTELAAKRGLSRRTMIAATAWTVPAVIAATSTPAMAASPGVVSFTGEACKHPGNSQAPFRQDYHFVLQINNTTAESVEVEFTAMWKNGSPKWFAIGAGEVPINDYSKFEPVPVGGKSYIIHLNDSDSAQSEITVFYKYGDVSGTTAGAGTTPPCDYLPTSTRPNRYP